jgi:lipoyl(octanoyl) transferase
MNSWFWLNSGKCDPAYNMALDEALLEAVARLRSPVLRFYGWTGPAVTFGYFQKYAEVERTTSLRPLIRRPTGGGIVPHDADWTYSLVFPPGHEWYSLKAVDGYRRIHEWIRSAFARLDMVTELAPKSHPAGPGQCFVGYEKSDLLWHGKKIAGAAQRRNKSGLLIQGSVQPPLPLARAAWQQAMCDVGQMASKIKWSDFEPDGPLCQRADALVRQKYSQREFITKR